MILLNEIKELGFEYLDSDGNKEAWSYESESGILVVEFHDYQKTVKLYISECGYKAEAELKGEVTIERIKNLIKALQ